MLCWDAQQPRLLFTQLVFLPPCQELQDQIDELHSELQEYRAQGKVLRPSLKNSLSEEFDMDMKSHGNGGIEPDQGKKIPPVGLRSVLQVFRTS